ncbi:GNAT family N-acetyltransferase [Nevskia ramosa]|uniref:GNAT family N-acetyltransferase n=1 Tax=Nevskia ramosa TaxID=64002 RepID=UPI003D097FD4
MSAAAASAGGIRRGSLADVEAVLALEALFPSDRMSRRSVRRFLSVPSAQLLIAEDTNADVVGNLVWLRRKGGHAARIYSVVVAPAARGQRWGERLVAAMETAAAASGCARATLEVRADNIAARALYAKLGYREVQTLPGYYDDGSDGLRLSKTLSV